MGINSITHHITVMKRTNKSRLLFKTSSSRYDIVSKCIMENNLVAFIKFGFVLGVLLFSVCENPRLNVDFTFELRIWLLITHKS